MCVYVLLRRFLNNYIDYFRNETRWRAINNSLGSFHLLDVEICGNNQNRLAQFGD